VSPTSTRVRRQQQQRHTYPRSEIVTAVLGSAAVVILTAIAIWMLRPGTAFTPGTGGLAHRQPRATWLVAGTLLVMVVGVIVVVRSPRWRRHLIASISVVVVGSLVLAVVVGALWPSGLLRHYQQLVGPNDFNTVSTPASAPTTAPGATTAPSATTAPPGTTVATTPPTSGG
jgi:hypothetical protein